MHVVIVLVSLGSFVVGCFVALTALTLQPESAMHQIYQANLMTTAAVLILGAVLIAATGSIRLAVKEIRDEARKRDATRAAEPVVDRERRPDPSRPITVPASTVSSTGEFKPGRRAAHAQPGECRNCWTINDPVAKRCEKCGAAL